MVKIVTSNFLKDSVIKSVLEEYNIKSQELSKDELTYGTQVIEPPYDPFLLEKLRDISGLHDTCIKVKAEDAIYSGKKLICEGEIPSEINDLLNDFDFDEETVEFAEQLDTFGFAGLELLKENGKLKAVNCIASLYLRMCRDKKRVVQKIGADEAYFKLYNPNEKRKLNRKNGMWDIGIESEKDEANEIIWFNTKSNESQVYGRPKYLSELDAIITDNAIVEYQQGHFKSNGVPNYIVTVTGNIDEEIDDNYTLDDWEEDIEKEFREIKNEPGTAICLVIPSEENGVNVNVTKITDEKKEGSFLELSESISTRIYRIHGVPRERLGDSDTTGIASNRTSVLLKNYSSSTVRIIQKRIANLIQKTIIKREFQNKNITLQYLPANFENEDAALERGIKFLQNGAMTLGEFINNFGSALELSMDEDDEFYNCRFMNNQSLNSVVYGETPMDAEGKLNTLIEDLGNEINNQEEDDDVTGYYDGVEEDME